MCCTRDDLISFELSTDQKLSVVSKQDPEYDECAELMYDYYEKTHSTVNPLTASKERFRMMLPDTALFSSVNGTVVSAAFVEDSEIAYVASEDLDHFRSFARSMLELMFSRYDHVVFEADDTDRAATYLMSLFSNVPELSWNTYIKYTAAL